MSLQLACYDQAKQLVLSTGLLSDNIFTHFLASFIAVSRAGRGEAGLGLGLPAGAQAGAARAASRDSDAAGPGTEASMGLPGWGSARARLWVSPGTLAVAGTWVFSVSWDC